MGKSDDNGEVCKRVCKSPYLSIARPAGLSDGV